MIDDQLWTIQKEKAINAFNFWNEFMALRMGDDNDRILDSTAKDRFIAIIRAVSWVESKHGSGSGNQAAKDPMQTGNPGDHWWKELTGQSGNGSRFILGPGKNNFWAKELSAAAENVPTFPDSGKIGKLANKSVGHGDPAFNAILSYYWGIAYLIHKVNTSVTDGKTYQCDDCLMERMIDGAVGYNGGGDSQYRKKITEFING